MTGNWTRFLATLPVAAIGLAGALAVTAARADDVPTGGVVNNSNGGNAHIANIADLKAPIDASDYDDDPLGEPGSEYFHVAPNLGDAPLQEANKYIIVYNPDDVAELQVTLRTRPGGTVVWESLVPGSAGMTGADCQALLGAVGESGTVADGLVATGQKTSEEITDIRNRCTQRTGGVWQVTFPVSKHLPPGWYDQCVAISHLGGGSTPRECVPIRIVAVTGYETDVEALDFGTLKQDIRSVDEGDFVMGNDAGTIMGTGNTSPTLAVSYSWMKNDTFDVGTSKYIRNDFDVQINRRDDSGLITSFDAEDGLLGGADPDSADPFDGSDVATLDGVCLEPNEPLKLDFSVTPRQVLYDGEYNGLVRLTLAEADGETDCVPSLGSGETASGDLNGPFNNLPGEEVEQDLSGGGPEPTPTASATSEPTETSTVEPTGTTEPTETPTETETPSATPTESETPVESPTATETPGSDTVQPLTSAR